MTELRQHLRRGTAAGRPAPRRAASARWRVGGMIVALGVIAANCGHGSTLAPGTAQLDAQSGFWALTLNHRALTLSTVPPYDTLRLVPTPRDLAGTPLTGAVLDSVVTTYTLQDPSDTSVAVGPDGLVHARYPHDGGAIVVRTQVRGVTRTDTVLVKVTTVATPPHAQALAVQASPDTLTTSLLNDHPEAALTAQALDDQGQAIPGVVVKFSTTNPTLLAVANQGGTDGTATWQPFVRPAPVWVRAEATVYGARVVDSVPVTLTPPSAAILTAVFGLPRSVGTPVGHFDPAVDTVQLVSDPFGGDGATVVFQNTTGIPIDVVFDDPAAVSASGLSGAFGCDTQGGNVPAFVQDRSGCFLLANFGWQLRLFPTPGTYHYHSALYGTAGTIVVVP